MKQEHTLREKGQAVFLAALMVLSVFAMSAAFAGAAAAQVGVTVTVTDDDDNPIADASVAIDGDNEQTDDDGVAVFSDVANDGSAEITVTADGYEEYEDSPSDAEIASGQIDVTLDADNGDEGDEADEGDATDSSFDSSNYAEEAGDVVDFTIDMEHADEAVVVLEDEDGNYWADLHVDADGEDEVNVSFNSYNAGQDGADAFSTDTEDAEVDVHNERTITDGTHLNPGAYTFDLSVNEDGDSIDVESVDDGDRADVEGLELAYTAELELSEGSIGDELETGVAPADADFDNVSGADDIENVSSSDAVTEGDYLVTAVDASGVFGYLADNDLGEEITFEMEQTNPETYDAPNQFNHTDVDVVEDPENNQMFFILDTSNEDIEAGAEYDVTFTATEDFAYVDEDTEATTSFSVEERSVEVTGDFDEDDRLQVELDENSTVTGESSAAPGSDTEIRLGLGTPDHPTLSQTAQVQDDGTIEADFNVSDREVDEELDVEIEDQYDGDVNDSVSAVFVDAADDHDQDPHTVTITVTDADGEPVEDAEVEVDGQTETTDSNGEATFELHHGEYDVSATHDGETASGTITVDDETADTGSLTLGEEDTGEISDPDDGADDGVDDHDDGVDDSVDDSDDGVDDGADDYDAPEDDTADDTDDAADDTEDQPGFGIAVALIALLAAAGIALRNRA